MIELITTQSNPSIAYTEPQHNLVGGAALNRGRHHDLPLIRELHCIAGKVRQHLTQSQGVANQGLWHIRTHGKQHLQLAFVASADGYQIPNAIKYVLEVEGNRLHLQLTGFDLGEIQDVIDNPQQRFGCPTDLLDVA